MVYISIKYKYIFSLLSLAIDLIQKHRRKGSMGQRCQPSGGKEQGKGKYSDQAIFSQDPRMTLFGEADLHQEENLNLLGIQIQSPRAQLR